MQYGNHQSNIRFLEILNLLKKSDAILEIGSGEGHMLRYLKDQGFTNVMGIEPDAKRAQRATVEQKVRVEETVGNDLKFPDSSFDIVLSFDVFEHISNSDKHLQEVRRVLKSGGYYIFGTPNKLTNVPYSMIKDRSFFHYKTYHCSLHTFWQLKRRLVNFDFSYTFIDVPVVNEFFVKKMRRIFGHVGPLMLRCINPDRLPKFLRTNFYVVAQKK